MMASVAIAQPTTQIRDYPFDQVAKNTWVMHGPLEMPNKANQGFMNNPAFVITSAGAVLVDPGSSVYAGEMVLRNMRKVTDKPIIAVINTHIHGDHWLGNQAIRAAWPDVKIYGHPKMLAAIEAGAGETWVDLMDTLTEGVTKGTRVVAPSHAIGHGDSIQVGDTSFLVHHYGQAHTITDIMIQVVEEKLVFLGDNVTAKRLPRLSDGNFQGNIQTIDQILETDAMTWVPGHGQTGDRSMVAEYREYLDTIYRVAAESFRQGLDSSDVKEPVLEATSKFSDWAGYQDEVGRHGAQAYLEVEAAEF